MQETMNALMKAMNRLKKARMLLDIWTLIVSIILAVMIVLNMIPPYVIPQSPFFAVFGGVYLAFLLILFLANRLVKDTQKQILVSLVRAFLGFIIPLILVVLFISSLLVTILTAMFAIVFLVILLLLVLPIMELSKLQKQLKPKPEAKPTDEPKPKAKPKAKPKPKSGRKSK